MKATLLLLGFVLFASLSSKAQTDQTWIDLDGTNDYLDLGADPILAGQTAFTVEMRMHFDNPTGEYTIIGQRDSDLNRTFVIQRWSGALYILFDGSNYASCAFEPCTGELYHLAAAYNGAGATDSDRLAFYINGVAQTLTFSGVIPATTLVTSPAANLVLGCEHNGAATQLQFLDGQFGEVCIWDHALTSTAIAGRVTPEVAGTEPGLVEYFHFDDGVPGGNNTGITSFDGGNSVSTIQPTNLAMNGAASNFVGPASLTGAIDLSVMVVGHLVSAGEPGAIYQWLDCDNGFAPIPGATAQDYTTTADGSYAVRITVGACTDTSACADVVTTGIATEQASSWAIYPNPVQDRLTVELGNTENVSFAIMDATGRVVRRGNVVGKATIEVADLVSGIYLLQIGTGSARGVKVFEKN
jgi:hypothetical protein